MPLILLWFVGSTASPFLQAMKKSYDTPIIFQVLVSRCISANTKTCQRPQKETSLLIQTGCKLLFLSIARSAPELESSCAPSCSSFPGTTWPFTLGVWSQTGMHSPEILALRGVSYPIAVGKLILQTRVSLDSKSLFPSPLKFHYVWGIRNQMGNCSGPYYHYAMISITVAPSSPIALGAVYHFLI